jgi:hypothetical protein
LTAVLSPLYSAAHRVLAGFALMHFPGDLSAPMQPAIVDIHGRLWTGAKSVDRAGPGKKARNTLFDEIETVLANLCQLGSYATNGREGFRGYFANRPPDMAAVGSPLEEGLGDAVPVMRLAMRRRSAQHVRFRNGAA